VTGTAATDASFGTEPREEDPRPVVTPPRSGLPGAAVAVIAVVIAGSLFIVLDGRRQRLAAARSTPANPIVGMIAPPPPLIVPPEPQSVPVQPSVTVVTRPPPILPPAVIRTTPLPLPVALPPVPITPAPQIVLAPPSERPPQRSTAPALVIDGGVAVETLTSAAQPASPRQDVPPSVRAGQGGSSDSPARATTIGNRTTVMPVGTVIPAVLETPIDTARPGLLRAVVSEDARGFDGRRVLVPRGSRLIGEYQAEVRANQKRVLVTWTRLIRPDGATIRLDSPAADRLGGAGVPGRLNTFFLQRFASAVLQSALQVGVNLASRPGDGSVIIGLPGTQVTNVVGQTLPQQGTSFQPKITVKPGAAVNVFVARDLDFSGVPSRP
jgi:type IV secretion system protein VirB10